MSASDRLSRLERVPGGARWLVVAAILVATLAAAWQLQLSPGGLLPSAGGLEIGGRFLLAAVQPTLNYEAEFVPPGAPPLLLQVAEYAMHTVLYAAAAMSITIVFGAAAGILASRSFWSDRSRGAASAWVRVVRRTIGPTCWSLIRIISSVIRSVHELIWAVLFLCAFGRTELGAVLAIALPYSATLAKVFAELIDEAPRDAAAALSGSGATTLQAFAFGLLPRALPDIAAYGFYRFECALRSAAVLGFFGYPTLGLAIRLSYENSHYREVWTYLYALFALVAGFELWSSALRRRMVGQVAATDATS